MLIEMKRQQEIAEGKREREEREEYEWGTGKIQKQQHQSQIDEFQKIKSQVSILYCYFVPSVYLSRIIFHSHLADMLMILNWKSIKKAKNDHLTPLIAKCLQKINISK